MFCAAFEHGHKVKNLIVDAHLNRKKNTIFILSNYLNNINVSIINFRVNSVKLTLKNRGKVAFIRIKIKILETILQISKGPHRYRVKINPFYRKNSSD